jgi:hypothetical protein
MPRTDTPDTHNLAPGATCARCAERACIESREAPGAPTRRLCSAHAAAAAAAAAATYRWRWLPGRSSVLTHAERGAD